MIWLMMGRRAWSSLIYQCLSLGEKNVSREADKIMEDISHQLEKDKRVINCEKLLILTFAILRDNSSLNPFNSGWDITGLSAKFIWLQVEYTCLVWQYGLTLNRKNSKKWIQYQANLVVPKSPKSPIAPFWNNIPLQLLWQAVVDCNFLLLLIFLQIKGFLKSPPP